MQGVLLLPDVIGLGLGSFRLGSGGPRRFTKDVLRVGSWVHPATGQKISFDRAALEKLGRDTNEWIALGNKVYFPDGHTSSALANLGSWSNFRVEGDTLQADVDVADDEAAKKVGKTITDVSPAIQPNALASTGQTFKSVILHVAATPEPVVPGQGNFVRLARAQGVQAFDWSDAARDAAAEARRSHAAAHAEHLKRQSIDNVTHESGPDSEKVTTTAPAFIQDFHKNLTDQGFERTGTPRQIAHGLRWKHPNGTTAKVTAKGTMQKGFISTEFKSAKGKSPLYSENSRDSSDDDDNESVTALSHDGNTKETLMSKQCPAPLLSAARAFLGNPDADETAAIAGLEKALADLKKADSEEDDDEEGSQMSDEKENVDELSRLSRDLADRKKNEDALKAQVKSLLEDKAKRIKLAAEEKVQLARQRSAEVGVPLEKDVADEALALLSRDDDASQRSGAMILKLAHDRATARPIYERELANPSRMLEQEEPNSLLLASGYKANKDEKGRVTGYSKK